MKNKSNKKGWYDTMIDKAMEIPAVRILFNIIGIFCVLMFFYLLSIMNVAP